jgi:hypothetical protein
VVGLLAVYLRGWTIKYRPEQLSVDSESEKYGCLQGKCHFLLKIVICYSSSSNFNVFSELNTALKRSLMLRCHTRTNSKGQFKLHRDDSKTHSLLPLTGSLHFRLETTRFNENATRRLQVEAILLQVTEMQVLATCTDRRCQLRMFPNHNMTALYFW